MNEQAALFLDKGVKIFIGDESLLVNDVDDDTVKINSNIYWRSKGHIC